MFVFGSQVLLQKHILTLERGILDRSGPNKSCGPANFRLTSVDHLKRSKRGNFSLGKVCSICFSEICLQNFEHFWGEFRRRRKKTKALSGTTVFGATTPVSVAVRKVGNLPNRWKPVSGERDCVAASLPCLPSARVCALRVRGTERTQPCVSLALGSRSWISLLQKRPRSQKFRVQPRSYQPQERWGAAELFRNVHRNGHSGSVQNCRVDFLQLWLEWRRMGEEGSLFSACDISIIWGSLPIWH